MKIILVLLALALITGCSKKPKPLPLYESGQACTVTAFDVPVQIIEPSWGGASRKFSYYVYTKDLVRHYFEESQLNCKESK